MTIHHHFCFDYDEEIAKKLDELNVKYDWLYEPSKHYSEIFLDIDEDHPCYDKVLCLLPEDYFDPKKLVFSNKEIDETEYLTMRTHIMTLDLEAYEKTFEYAERIDESRVMHMWIVGDFYIKRPVKWGKRHFVSAYRTGRGIIFCDDHAMEKLEKTTRNIQFHPVFHSRTNNVMDNVHYMELTRELPKEAIDLSQGLEKEVCPVCGRVQYEFEDLFQLRVRREYLSMIEDIGRTPFLFGGGNFQSPLNIVTHDFYQKMKGENLIKGLVFEPVVII